LTLLSNNLCKAPCDVTKCLPFSEETETHFDYLLPLAKDLKPSTLQKIRS